MQLRYVRLYIESDDEDNFIHTECDKHTLETLMNDYRQLDDAQLDLVDNSFAKWVKSCGYFCEDVVPEFTIEL